MAIDVEQAEETAHQFHTVTKRDGRVIPFDVNRISSAVCKAMEASGEGNLEIDPDEVALRVVETLAGREQFAPSIEEIQDVVEEVLVLEEFPRTAKAYILYRRERAEIRNQKREIPEQVRNLVDASKKFFSSDYEEFIFWRTYSRWNDDLGRRETWIESVDRYMSYMHSKLGDLLTHEEYQEIREYIEGMKAMPSMRLFWSAGVAADFDNACAYNCSFIVPSEMQDFGEILYLLMCGCGVGFSVEAQNVEKLPIIKHQEEEASLDYYVVADSKQGWADALVYGLKTWYDGRDVEFDMSMLRGPGARLKTMGGRSSGKQPLVDLLKFARSTILAKQGRRLSSLNVHDIICKTGECVVSGGVRRSSLISLSSLDDMEMRNAKSGHFFLHSNHRQLANNSVAYDSKPSSVEFMREWLALAESGSGERGIFNRGSLPQQIPSRRLHGLEKHLSTMGFNPCSEIILRNKEFCNLSTVIARPDDTLASLKKKIRVAAILGTFQSMLTYFPYLSPEWKENCEAERLLGVSVGGQWDSQEFRKVDVQRWSKAIAVQTNEEYAKRFGINPSMAVTCVKPDGNTSQLTNAASGCHPRYAKNYIRRVRISATDPLFHMLKNQGYPYHPENGQSLDNATTFVLEFPVKAPEGSVTRHDMSAISQLEYWRQLREHFTEHNASCTAYVDDDEWFKVGNWVYENWDIVSGLAFLPKDKNVYPLAPYEEITAEEYERLASALPPIDFAEVMLYEVDDNTQGAKEFACIGISCEV